MNKTLTKLIADQSELTFASLQIALMTCQTGRELGGIAVWRILYRALFRLDACCSDLGYLRHTPPFPVPEGAERFDTPWKGKPLSKDQLVDYYSDVRAKMSLYLDEMTDGLLLEADRHSLETRADRLLGELRFCSAECGRINALTELSAGKRPVFVAGSSDLPKGRNYYTDQ